MTLTSARSTNAFFASTHGGRRFAVTDSPSGDAKGCILFIQPFAEEMNKCRRMTALAARALAADGWFVLRPDLFGTGDSAGDFGQASWSRWIDDVSFWYDWLAAKSFRQTVVWSARAGALLCTAWLEKTKESCSLLFWQPVTNGQQHIHQFLRLKAASQMLDAGQSRGIVADLKAELEGGKSIDVAGYELAPGLVIPLSQARLSLDAGYEAPVRILEAVSTAEAGPAPAVIKTVETMRSQGIDIGLQTCVGPKFWSTVEIETLPEMIQGTVAAAARL